MKKIQSTTLCAVITSLFCISNFAFAENLNQFGGGGFSNSPENSFPGLNFETPKIKMVIAPDNQSVWGYSVQTGKWDSFKLSRDKTNVIVPTMGTNIVGCVVGDQLLAYGAEAGKWHSVKIDPEKIKFTNALEQTDKKATGGTFFQIKDEQELANNNQNLIPIGPTLSNNMVGFKNGKNVYASSSTSKNWQKVEFPEGEQPTLTIFNEYVQAQSQNYLYLFSIKTNKWSGLKVKTRKNKPASLEKVK